MNFQRLIKLKSNAQRRWSTDEMFKYAFICNAFIVVHFIYLCFFIWLNILPLCAYGLFSTIFYIYLSVNAVRKKQVAKILYATVIEVIIYSMFCSAMIGWDFGFMIYLLAMIPIVFYLFTGSDMQNAHRTSSLFTLLVILIFTVIRWYTAFHAPLYKLAVSKSLICTVYCINCLLAFVMQTIFSYIHTAEIQKFKNNLESEKEILDAIANKDPLTGLLNRRAMEPHLNEAKQNAEKVGSLFSLVLCDIDDFKKVNDIHGHALGDQVLKSISATFLSGLRESDYACRWGGEEFLLLIPGEVGIAKSIAERLRTQVSELTFEGEKTFSVTMTFGITGYVPGYRIEKLIKLADDNLYKGKANGKNQVVCSS